MELSVENSFRAHAMSFGLASSVDVKASLWSVSWSAERKLMCGSVDASIYTFDNIGDGSIADAKPDTFQGHSLGVTSVSTSRDGKIACSSSLDSAVRVWDVTIGELVRCIEPPPLEAYTVALSPDGKTIASGSSNGCLNLWSVATGKRLANIPTGMGKFLMSVAFSSNGDEVACGSTDGIVHLFDVSAEQHVHKFNHHNGSVRTVAFASAPGILASGGDDALVNLYDGRTRTLLSSMEGHKSWTLGMSYAPDDAVLATCSADKSVRVWDLGLQQCIETVSDAHPDQAWGIAFDPDAVERKRFALVGDDQVVRLYQEGAEAGGAVGSS